MSAQSKVILLGIDQLDWRCLQVFLDRGFLPNFERLMNISSSGPFVSDPYLSKSSVWTTILTGYTPSFHGVLSDLQYGPGGLSAQEVTNRQVRVPRVWDYASQRNLKSNIMGWPALSPASSNHGLTVVNGIQHIDSAAIDIWPLSPNAVSPKSWRGNVLDNRVFADDIPAEYIQQLLKYLSEEEKSAIKAPARLLFSQLLSLHSIGMKLGEDEDNPWQLLALRFDTLDYVSNLPSQLNFNGNTLSYLLGWYQFIDAMLAKYLSYKCEEDYLVLVSDCGVNPALIGYPTGLASKAMPGVLFFVGPDIPQDKPLDTVSILDIAPTILAMLGIEHGDMRGNTLFDLKSKHSVRLFVDTPPIEEIDAEQLKPLYRRSNLYTSQSSYESAVVGVDLSSLERVSDMLYSELLSILAEVKFQQGHLGQCVDLCEKSLQIRPDIINVLILLCRAYAILGDFKTARQIIDKYRHIAIHPIWENIIEGFYAYAAGDWKSATSAFNKLALIEHVPINAQLWLAEVLIKQENYSAAVKHLELAVKSSIELAVALERMAFVKIAVGDFPQALEVLNLAISYNPDKAQLFVLRFEVQAALGDFNRAKGDLFRALKLQPGVITEKQANKILMLRQGVKNQAHFELIKF
ncbi:alkaline phosphatase family protein [Methylophilus aquaticus]|uniref:Alkaline phosphatase family protein n=1 Tax=Methylophilus aquaticus TaxID=1971610 RepID=A0ABT9JT32_9PROT|nr:alkaline phosphatase family protein [Methylophilus aquaticus]MDP8567747.1 alkaline phosphatase family protein [Methylophilus aquaticus]